MSIRDLFHANLTEGIKECTVSGWVRTVRDSKAFGFIELNDGTFFKNLQIVLEDGLTESFSDAVKITLGSAIRATGELVLTPGMKQPFEIKAAKVEVLGMCAPEYPLQKKRHTFEFLRTIAHLRPRTNTFYAVFRIRSLAAQFLHAFFAERGFVYVHTPIITTSDCEGAGEMFQVTTLPLDKLPMTPDGQPDYGQDFFGKQASLTVSGQLNVETYCMAFRNVYTFGPTFRAEKSYTPRHAAEFWMVEPEIAFADLFDDMALAEDMLKYVIGRILAEAPEEMAFLNSFVEKGLIDRLNAIVNSDFARCTYTEAIDILKSCGQKFDYPVEWGVDLQTEHERYLSEKHFGRPVFVYNYPKEIKAFYMRMNDDQKTVAAVDLLVPGVGELIGGSQREERLDVLTSRIRELGMREEDYSFYLDTRRYGSTPHAGFGLGFERLVMYLTGMQNIRDVLPFPRTTGSAEY
ncbi:MAG: asparagine--tRNA ligase [Clostridiales bacterium]|nr:asparagine--tRNA ligase [Clostridiales bacterium]MDO4349932.1 asparagine--tRNA ligase [Eubacteriales bacterium]MDY4008154.1 asparagine--tRNA ligase [Candidatus Limiplasma sp.]